MEAEPCWRSNSPSSMAYLLVDCPALSSLQSLKGIRSGLLIVLMINMSINMIPTITPIQRKPLRDGQRGNIVVRFVRYIGIPHTLCTTAASNGPNRGVAKLFIHSSSLFGYLPKLGPDPYCIALVQHNEGLRCPVVA